MLHVHDSEEATCETTEWSPYLRFCICLHSSNFPKCWNGLFWVKVLTNGDSEYDLVLQHLLKMN